MNLYSMGRKRSTEKFLSKYPNPAEARMRLERFYNETEPYYGVRMGTDFVILEKNLVFHLIDSKDIVWIYTSVTSQKLYGLVTLSKIYTLVVRTRDNRIYSIPLPSEKASKALIQAMFARFPNVYFGYSEEIEQFYRETKGSYHAEFQLLGRQQHTP